MFAALQDRLPKELRLVGVTTMGEATRFLEDVYLADHDARFAMAPEHPESTFVRDRLGAHRDILCVREKRVVDPFDRLRRQHRARQGAFPANPAKPEGRCGPLSSTAR